jgi:hypothetical protein
VEAIKVDRSFVNGLGIDSEDSTIVEAVINLGHSLGLSVVAEGVETPLQLSRLRDLGCDRGQGYLFGRPRPADVIEDPMFGLFHINFLHRTLSLIQCSMFAALEDEPWVLQARRRPVCMTKLPYAGYTVSQCTILTR